MLAAVTSDGQVSQFQGTVDQRGPTFPVVPGDVKVVLTVRDKEEHVLDTETRTLTVPPAGGQELAWSSPTLFRGRSPIEMRAINGDPNPPPFAGHEFARADRLLVRVALYGDSADATVASRLVGRQGHNCDAPDRAARRPRRVLSDRSTAPVRRAGRLRDRHRSIEGNRARRDVRRDQSGRIV